MKTTKCSVCNTDFPSRNKLFQHLESSGHGSRVSSVVKDTSQIGDDDINDSIQPQLSKGNDAYYEYYRRQKICNEDNHDEVWKEAYHKLRTPLPITYRIHESNPLSAFSVDLLSLMDKNESDGHESQLKDWSFTKSKNEEDDTSIPKLRMTITSNVHRSNKRSKDDLDKDKFSSVLHALQELGSIHRQELVSAIPPLVLWSAGSSSGNTSGPIVADMCAAPGSKSLQLLDMLYTSNNSSSIPSGLLVVNDSDRNRIVTLCQRTRHVPRAPMLAINMDARYFPGMRRSHIIKQKAGYKQKYDMVLCDAPCSGDGTTRKSKPVWNTWSMGHAMSLHRLQRRILRRGLELLRPGGIIVYSTCSLNPLEDEAVVASVIDNVGGTEAVEILPLPDWLIEKCKKGLITWQVPNPKFGKNGVNDMYQTFEDVPSEHQASGMKEKSKKKKGGQVSRTMFPPSNNNSLTEQLGHCGRFIPNDSLDSGGFFVACLKRIKVGELGDEEKTQAREGSAAESTAEDKEQQDIKDTISPATENQDTEPTPSDAVEVREGDWYCGRCEKLNFASRKSCFSCKVRKPRAKTDKKDDTIQQPLLRKPVDDDASVLNTLYNEFGIAPTSLPLDNIRIIHRKSEKMIVLVSTALSKLAISDSWGAVRELGISLASLPNEDGPLRLVDEGLHVVTQHATRRHLKLSLDAFLNALAQSVKQLLSSSSKEEVERVKNTLDRSFNVDTLCKEEMWYDSLNDDPLKSMWKLCKESPGYFIVSCELNEGCFSFSGSFDSKGTVTVQTSLRVIAAMLVVVHKYSELISLDSSSKRPRLGNTDQTDAV